MKPLSSYTYIKSNARKVLPSFICTIISVFLIYLFGLLLYGSVEVFYKIDVNVVNNGTLIYSNSSNKPISDKIAGEIKKDKNVGDIIPFLGMNNAFNYQAVFGGMGTNSFIVYSEDVNRALKDFGLKLISGRIPRNNESEIILPQELAKQYKLKVGDYISNATDPSIHLDRTYRLVGITKGDSWVPIVCDVGKIKRDDALKHGMVFFFKNPDNKALNERLVAMKDKNLVMLEYKSMRDELNAAVGSIDVLYYSLAVIILAVLCISLSNLNYIVFLNKKNEFSVLATIGISKGKLRRKLFTENTFVCLVGFVIGIGITTLVTELLNLAVWQNNGQHIGIFRASALMVAFIMPILVSILSMVSSVKEFNKLSYESLNN